MEGKFGMEGELQCRAWGSDIEYEAFISTLGVEVMLSVGEEGVRVCRVTVLIASTVDCRTTVEPHLETGNGNSSMIGAFCVGYVSLWRQNMASSGSPNATRADSCGEP